MSINNIDQNLYTCCLFLIYQRPLIGLIITFFYIDCMVNLEFAANLWIYKEVTRITYIYISRGAVIWDPPKLVRRPLHVARALRS